MPFKTFIIAYKPSIFPNFCQHTNPHYYFRCTICFCCWQLQQQFQPCQEFTKSSLTPTPGHLGLHGHLVLEVADQKESRREEEFVSHHKAAKELLMLGECVHLVSVQNHHDHCGMNSVPDIIMCHIKAWMTFFVIIPSFLCYNFALLINFITVHIILKLELRLEKRRSIKLVH